MIYFDHNATTPLLPEVAEAMRPWLAGSVGNPASQHTAGRRARLALEEAREGIAAALGANLSGRAPDRVLFTSGGTEANNLALLGLAGGVGGTVLPGDLVVSSIEHPSVAGCAEMLERRGWRVHRLPVDGDGVVQIMALDDVLSDRTRLVSVMLANNETGVIQPLAEIAARCAKHGVPVHTDAAQIVGKLPVDFSALGVSALTVAAHKLHGPLGIGVLLAKHDLPLEPLLVGGFQQEGLRPGTENVALAVGLHAALVAFRLDTDRAARLAALRDELETTLAANAGPIFINGVRAPRVPHTSNIAFLGLDRQALLMALDLAGIACSTGSACASGSSEPSHVLKAMHVAPSVLASSLRFSLGAMTTPTEIDQAAATIATICGSLRESRPAIRVS